MAVTPRHGAPLVEPIEVANLDVLIDRVANAFDTSAALNSEFGAHDHAATKGVPIKRVQSGTFAARPASAAANAGHVYVATDTGQFFFDTGVAWVTWANPAPWLVDIDVFGSGSTATNWATHSVNVSNLYNGNMGNTGAVNDQIGWDVVLSAGTWTLELIHSTAANRGIYTVALDGVTVGTIDGYSAGAVNVISTITGIAVASSGKTRLTLTMATKNASSSNFYGIINHVQLRRTA